MFPSENGSTNNMIFQKTLILNIYQIVLRLSNLSQYILTNNIVEEGL